MTDKPDALMAKSHISLILITEPYELCFIFLENTAQKSKRKKKIKHKGREEDNSGITSNRNKIKNT